NDDNNNDDNNNDVNTKTNKQKHSDEVEKGYVEKAENWEIYSCISEYDEAEAARPQSLEIAEGTKHGLDLVAEWKVSNKTVYEIQKWEKSMMKAFYEKDLFQCLHSCDITQLCDFMVINI
ncbi:hypothetical protein RFI_23590, partial [Reticulomyxa filosa]